MVLASLVMLHINFCVKQITAKLLQERMLDDLQRDVVQARVHPDGKISLELTSKDLSLKSPN